MRTTAFTKSTPRPFRVCASGLLRSRPGPLPFAQRDIDASPLKHSCHIRPHSHHRHRLRSESTVQHPDPSAAAVPIAPIAQARSSTSTTSFLNELDAYIAAQEAIQARTEARLAVLEESCMNRDQEAQRRWTLLHEFERIVNAEVNPRTALPLKHRDFQRCRSLHRLLFQYRGWEPSSKARPFTPEDRSKLDAHLEALRLSINQTEGQEKIANTKICAQLLATLVQDSPHYGIPEALTKSVIAALSAHVSKPPDSGAPES